jgi:hypothetical protein
LSWQTLAPAEVPVRLAGWLGRDHGVIRLAVDGPPCSEPAQLAQALIGPLRALGRPVVHIQASSFWRDASLRLEHGRHDYESYLTWLDADALRREVLEPAVHAGSVLPSLRDPVTNRSTREPARPVEPETVLVVSGSLLLGLGLPFDRTVHLVMPHDARARRTPAEDAWTLPAFDAYDETVRPADIADVSIRVDRRNPAVRGLG